MKIEVLITDDADAQEYYTRTGMRVVARLRRSHFPWRKKIILYLHEIWKPWDEDVEADVDLMIEDINWGVAHELIHSFGYAHLTGGWRWL